MNAPPLTGTELFRSLRPEKQERVFQAAVQEFAVNGYRNASMNSVVKAAGISKGSLFQYFRTKQGLFDGVVEIAASRVRVYLKHVRDETGRMSFFERLEQLLHAGFSFIDHHHLLARIYFHLLQSGETPSGSERVALLRKQGVEFVADLIRVAKARGEVKRSVDVERTAFLINALLETLLRAYYTEFMASGLGLYRGNPEELAGWVQTALGLIREGIQRNDLD
ncbi:MAG: TetR/AcrR family transcriptional regulator [Deltaproteobacteria bacterium]